MERHLQKHYLLLSVPRQSKPNPQAERLRVDPAPPIQQSKHQISTSMPILSTGQMESHLQISTWTPVREKLLPFCGCKLKWTVLDFPEDDKPWRRPGTDMTDYFNYGFDEFTWASYCLKQGSLRKEVIDSKKQMEEMQNFLSMPSAMPGMPGAPGGAPPGMPPMGGPTDMPPEMQQMMAQMMSQGMDPTQLDPATFMQMMQGAQGGTGAADPNQSFGGQGFGQQGQNQQMGYGYGGGGGGGGGGGRNQGGRGNRRW